MPEGDSIFRTARTLHRALAGHEALGPDLLGPAFDAAEAIRRFREHQTSSIADTLINQRVLAGAGKVYKSVVLFLSGVNPFQQVLSVSDETLMELFGTAQKHLRANVTHPSGGIVTYRGFQRGAGSAFGSRLYVYGRTDLPCRRCGRPIEVAAQGPNTRLTYWCPGCQPRTSAVVTTDSSTGSSLR